jgi:regulatory protein
MESPYKPGRQSMEKALEKAKHFCGYQERCHQEVKQKLFGMGMFRDEVEELLSMLISEGYLNEARYAEMFVSGKSRIKGWGKQKIAHALRLKGVSAFNISKALAGLDDSDYDKTFVRAAEKKWESLKGEKNIFVRKAKWQSYLLQKGFEAAKLRSFVFPETGH